MSASKEERESISWLLSLYTSEVFFLFHLPLFVEIPYRTPVETTSSTYSLSNRLERAAFIRDGYHQPRPWFQLLIFVLRSILNLLFLIYVTIDLKMSKLWTLEEPHHVFDIFKGHNGQMGLFCLLLSAGLYVLSYIHLRFHLIHVESKSPGSVVIPEKLYWLSHFSIINFSLDLPAASVPSVRLSRLLVCVLNIIAIGIIVFVAVFEKQFIDAWQCYPEGTGVKDLKYGLCPAFLGVKTSPICDQPGIRCGRETNRYDSTFSSTITLCRHILCVSLAVYIVSITPKIQYWKTLHDSSVIRAERKSK